MRYAIYKFTLWLSGFRKADWARPLVTTMVITAACMMALAAVDEWLLPRWTLFDVPMATILLTSVIAGLAVLFGLRVYRQMAENTLAEITERLRLAEELEEERRHMRALMEHSFDYIFFKDTEGRYSRMNRRFAEALGLPDAALAYGRSAEDYFAPEHVRVIREDEARMLREGTPVIGKQEMLVWKDGRVTWASVTKVPYKDRSGAPAGFFCIARDITESHRIEQRLQQLSLAVEQSPSVVMITDVEGRIEYVNRSFTQLTGYEPDEVRGKKPSLLSSGRTPPSTIRNLWETITAGGEWRGELVNRKKNGEIYWGRTSISPIRGARGEITHYVQLLEDVTREKQAEERLLVELERREELERIIRRSPAVVFLWQATEGWPVEFVSSNVDQFGYSEEDFMSGRLLHAGIVHPDDLERVRAEITFYSMEGIDEFLQEYRIFTKAGDVRWLEVRTWMRREPGGAITHYQGLVIDVTEQKLAQHALTVSENRYRTLVEQLPGIIYVADTVRPSVLRYVSPQVNALLGFSEMEWLRTPESWRERVLAEDLAGLAEAEKRCAETGEPISVEFGARAKDGHVMWFRNEGRLIRDASGKPVVIQGILLDITKRRLAENARAVMIEGLRAVLIAAQELNACPELDDVRRRAVELGRSKLGLERCRILLSDGKQIQGSFGTSLAGETIDERAFRAPLTGVWGDRFKVRSPDEQLLLVLNEGLIEWDGASMVSAGRGWMAVTPIQSPQHGLLGLFCNDAAVSGAPCDPARQEVVSVFCSMLGTILDRKSAERDRRDFEARQRDIMERTDRLNSLGMLAAGMAHEINNPLQGILSHLHGLKSEVATGPGLSSLQMAERGVENIAGLVRKLLVLGTSREEGYRAADVGEALDFVVQLLSAEFKRGGIGIVKEVRRARLQVALSQRDMVQVLLNLLINARDAMAEGGQVSVRLDADEAEGIIHVNDTGSGIPEAIKDQVFTPFFTTKGPRGTGLGLSVAESILRAGRGSIAIARTSPRGTTFEIRIPLAKAGRT
jgi:PAS domain S-box-containing protein